MKYRATKDIAADVRQALKEELPDWKFSVVTSKGGWSSSITVSLVEGPEQVLIVPEDIKRGHVQLNPYYIDKMPLTDKGREVMSKALEILSRDHWDESDPMTDYFYCAYYRHMNIGKWNRPYRVK